LKELVGLTFTNFNGPGRVRAEMSWIRRVGRKIRLGALQRGRGAHGIEAPKASRGWGMGRG